MKREAKRQARLLCLHSPKLRGYEEHGDGSGFGYDMWEALQEDKFSGSNSK